MRKSRIREKLKLGEPVLLTKINVPDPVIVDMIGLSGFDGVWMCYEHVPIDGDRLGHLIRAASMNNLDSIVRVSKGGYSDYLHPLELGGTGLMVPHCMSASEARELVRTTRFHPLGLRPLDSGNSDGHYCMVPLTDYMRHSNENNIIVAQIEDPAAVEQIDEIAAVEGIDALFIGPGDLSQALGVPGHVDHPEVRKAIERVAAACAKSGRPWGLPVNATNVQRFRDMGGSFFASGADVLGLGEYYRSLREKFQDLGFEFTPRI